MSAPKTRTHSAALIVAIVALIAALGGSAVAITALSKKERKQVKRIARELDKDVASSAARRVKGLRRDIRKPLSGKTSLPVLDEPVCGESEGWYSTPTGQIRFRVDLGGEVRLSGAALYCGGPKVAFTLPEPFRPTDYVRRFPVAVVDDVPSGADVTVVIPPLNDPPGAVGVGRSGRVAVPDARVGDIVDLGSVAFDT